MLCDVYYNVVRAVTLVPLAGDDRRASAGEQATQAVPEPALAPRWSRHQTLLRWLCIQVLNTHTYTLGHGHTLTLAPGHTNSDTDTDMHIHLYTHTPIHTYTYTHIHLHTRTNTYTCTHLYAHAHLLIPAHTDTYIHLFLNTATLKHLHIIRTHAPSNKHSIVYPSYIVSSFTQFKVI